MGASSSKPARTSIAHVTTGVRDDGTRWVRSFKMLHPARQQRVFIVSCPRFALKAFYNDWCYQPYVKDHVLCISTDIEVLPVHAKAGRNFVMNRAKNGEYDDYDSFYARHMPDNVDAGITRRQMYYREHIIRTSAPRVVFATTTFRDKYLHHRYVRKQLAKLVGESNLYHPSVESGQSFVVFIPPAQVGTALNALEDLGFEVTEAIEHDIGDETKLARLDRAGVVANRLLVLYIYFMCYLVGLFMLRRTLENMKVVQAEMWEQRERLLQAVDAGKYDDVPGVKKP